jgi:acyl-CoA thioesterase I
MKSPNLNYVFLLLIGLTANVYAAGQSILIFGDSLSASYGIAREAGWGSLLQQALPQEKIINASISGETAAGGKRRIAALLRQYQPTIVILELGANDGLRGAPIADIAANLNSLIEQIRASKARVLLLGMQLPPNYGAGYTVPFKALYPTLAQQHHIALLPFMLEGLNENDFQSDNLHPTAAAQEKIFRAVLGRLNSLLQ